MTATDFKQLIIMKIDVHAPAIAATPMDVNIAPTIRTKSARLEIQANGDLIIYFNGEIGNALLERIARRIFKAAIASICLYALTVPFAMFAARALHADPIQWAKWLLTILSVVCFLHFMFSRADPDSVLITADSVLYGPDLTDRIAFKDVIAWSEDSWGVKAHCWNPEFDLYERRMATLAIAPALAPEARRQILSAITCAWSNARIAWPGD
ncbi:hypothetical protein ACFWP0_26425 [Achromobacter sp. NPDC058515]|uniref:hypothetical protein n=1 Tax=Achromobacter sp. NPDC058515 TaxID=3346533 RepID=UPI003647CD58